MINSAIQWTDVTWNIARGCSKVDADCLFCYMYRDSFDSTRYNPKQVVRTKTVFNTPLKLKEPCKIFTSSLTDFFHQEIDSYRAEAWDIIRRCPQHTFQILTKRPERILACLPDDWGDGWENVWLGTSIGSQGAEYRITHLLKVPAAIHFLSLEPLHGPIELNAICTNDEELFGFEFAGQKLGAVESTMYSCLDGSEGALMPHVIDWVIIGGESGNDNGKYRYRACDLEWIQKIVNDCQEAGTAVFVKQLGTYLSREMGLSDRHGGNMEEFPESLKIRQFPVA